MSGRIASYADVHAFLARGGGHPGAPYSVQDCLTLTNGFLSPDLEHARFPESHAAWEELHRSLPHLLANLELLKALETFPVLDASANSLPDEFLGRASCFLGYAVHAAFAVHQALPQQASGTAQAPFAAPVCLDHPWRQVMGRLHRPYVGMTLTDYCYANVTRIDPSRPPSARNLQSAIAMTGSSAEQVSHASVSAVEYAAHWCLGGIDSLYAQKLRLGDNRKNDPGGEAATRAGIRQSLAAITAGILEMARAIQSLDVHRAPPAVWNIVTALWCSTRPGETGFDGTSSPSFGLLDSFFGRRRFDSELGRMTSAQFSGRIPEFQRDVLLAVRHEDFPAMIRSASARWPQEGDFGWTRCLDEYHALLRTHLRKVFSFLEVGRMITGRHTTNGDLHGHMAPAARSCPHHSSAGALPQDFYDAFERAIQERGTTAQIASTVVATSFTASGEVYSVDLTVPSGQPPLYGFPGDHIEVDIPPETAGADGLVRRYSLSSVSPDGRSASLTVARQGSGSRFVIGGAGVPHALTVRLMPSSFRLPADPRVPVALIAGGAGISPFLGFVQARAAIPPEKRGPLLVFLSARTKADCPRYRELTEFASAGVIELHVCYTREAARLTIGEMLQRHRPALLAILNDADGHVFVCGRPGFCLSVQSAIDAMGGTGRNARIQFECFGAGPGQADLPWLSWSTVRQHNHRDSAWIVVAGMVYDVTAYLKHHPGSQELLLIYAGRDATKAFHFAHASHPGVQALLAEMCIGRVPPGESDCMGVRADAVLRTLNSVMLLERLASGEAIIGDDDLLFRRWRARIVTAAWLGHIKDGVLPLLRASLPESAELLQAALANTESILNHVQRLANAKEYERAHEALQSFTGPIVSRLRQAAASPSDLARHGEAMLDHLLDFGCVAASPSAQIIGTA